MKLLDYFRKVHNKLSRKKARGQRTDYKLRSDDSYPCKVRLSPERCREIIQKAYPDAAKFMESIKIYPGTEDVFMLAGSFMASGAIGAIALSTSYREWERKCIEQVRAKHPNLMILAFHPEQD